MRVAHFIWSLERGGAENMLVDLANCQARHAQVSVVIGNREIDEDVAGGFDQRVHVVRLGRPRHSRNPFHLVRLHRELVRLRPDVVHSHSQNVPRLWPPLKCTLVVTVHSTEIDRRLNFRKYRRVFVISAAVAAAVGERSVGVPPVVVPNGISFSRIAAGLPAVQPPFQIVQIGRLDTETKGQDLLLAAVARLKAEGRADDVEVDFIGEGPSRPSLEGLVQRLGLSGRVRFKGALPRSAIYNSLSRYHLLVQPSRREGFGLAIVEAMAAKVPVLVADIEGPMEVISQGAHGFWFKREDADDLAEMILKVRKVSSSSDFAGRLDSTYAYARREFSVETTAVRYMDHYGEVAAEDRQRGVYK